MRPKTRTSPTIDALSRKCAGNDDAALHVELAGLSVVVDAVQKLQPRGETARHLRQLALDLEPHLHWVDTDTLPRHARDETSGPDWS
jgi:hypothetical protein